MTQQVADYQAVDEGVLACAARLAESIKNADGHAAAIEKIVPHYLAKNDVDNAARLADSVESSFVRDKLLVDVADKCAAMNDDEYALQLADAIEDRVFQQAARERIAIRKAEKSEFDKAFEIAETVDHNSYALGACALALLARGDEDRALQTVEKIADAAIKANHLQTVAHRFDENGQTEKALNLFERARAEAENVEIEEEEIAVLRSIADSYREIGRRDKAIEVLAQAQRLAEKVTGARRNALLGEISGDFLRAGSLDLADRALDLVDDKTIIAGTLTVYAAEYYGKNESTEALEILEEARGILKSYYKTGVRNSEETANVLSSVAVHFALVGKPERAIEVALEIPLDDRRYSALTQIAQICVSAENKGVEAQRAIGEINDRAKNLEALIAVADAWREKGENAEALKLLGAAHSEIPQVEQVLLKVALLGSLAVSFYQAGDAATARRAAAESLDQIPRIYDQSLRAAALADLAAVYETLGVELNQTEKDQLLALLRRGS